MFEVSEEAIQKMKQFLAEQQTTKAIRILMDEGGWKGPHLIMALDSQKEDDEVFNEAGVTFIIEKSLFDRAKPIHIGYTHSALGSGYTFQSEFMKAAKGATSTCHEICQSCEAK